MTYVRVAAASAMMIMLAGCAGSISQPKALMALTADQQSAVHISNITADGATGVNVTPGDIGMINEKVRNYISEDSPGVMVDPSTGDALTLKIHYTRFDRGNALARFILIGLGQIHIDAKVSLLKADGTSVAEYQVNKTFFLGGIAGGVTSVEDVEEGFAKSVAEVVKPKVAS